MSKASWREKRLKRKRTKKTCETPARTSFQDVDPKMTLVEGLTMADIPVFEFVFVIGDKNKRCTN